MNMKAWLMLGVAAAFFGCGTKGGTAQDRPWIDSFPVEKCTQLTTGRNEYFILEPGYQIVLASKKEQVAITVLDKTEKVNGIETRVIEETEFADGRLKEVSRNFFTICKEHGDVFYHGEDVDDYKDGKVVGHGGAWRAGVKGARAGLMMPGKIEVGYRHYQEVAPGVAMDRAEIVSDAVTIETPEGEFKKCARVEETTPLEKDRCIKVYAPGVGLVLDDDLVIVQHGPGRKPPAAPVEVKEDPSKYLSEVEIAENEMPAPVAARLKQLHPTGKIKEVKRENHPGGKVIYAIEIMIDGQQWDVELDPEGKVIVDKKE